MSDKDRQQAGSPWGPANPQALNRYSYVWNNPLRYTDPTGHVTLTKKEAAYVQYKIRTELIPAIKNADAGVLGDILVSIADWVCGNRCEIAALGLLGQGSREELLDILNMVDAEIDYFLKSAPNNANLTILLQRSGICSSPIGCPGTGYKHEVHIEWSKGGHSKDYNISGEAFAWLAGNGWDHRMGRKSCDIFGGCTTVWGKPSYG